MTRPGRRLPTATVASLLLGLALMLPFDTAVTRILGVTLLLTFVTRGTWLVADPAFLTHDSNDQHPPGTALHHGDPPKP